MFENSNFCVTDLQIAHPLDHLRNVVHLLVTANLNFFSVHLLQMVEQRAALTQLHHQLDRRILTAKADKLKKNVPCLLPYQNQIGVCVYLRN